MSSNTTLSSSHRRSSFSSSITGFHSRRMMLRESLEGISTWVIEDKIKPEPQGIISGQDLRRDIITMKKKKRKRRFKGRSKGGRLQKMLSKCSKIKLSKNMIWPKEGKKEKLTEWREKIRMMTSSRTNLKNHNLATAKTHTPEEEPLISMEHEEQAKLRNQPFQRTTKNNLQSHLINIVVWERENKIQNRKNKKISNMNKSPHMMRGPQNTIWEPGIMMIVQKEAPKDKNKRTLVSVTVVLSIQLSLRVTCVSLHVVRVVSRKEAKILLKVNSNAIFALIFILLDPPSWTKRSYQRNTSDWANDHRVSMCRRLTIWWDSFSRVIKSSWHTI